MTLKLMQKPQKCQKAGCCGVLLLEDTGGFRAVKVAVCGHQQGRQLPQYPVLFQCATSGGGGVDQIF